MANHPASGMSRNESELIEKCQRALDDGSIKDPVEKLRLLCLVRGVSGFVVLGRAFRRMDDDGNRALSLQGFEKVLRNTGMILTHEEGEEIFNR